MGVYRRRTKRPDRTNATIGATTHIERVSLTILSLTAETMRE